MALAIVEGLSDATLILTRDARPLGARYTAAQALVQAAQDVVNRHAVWVRDVDVPRARGEEAARDAEDLDGRVRRKVRAHPRRDLVARVGASCRFSGVP